jgi:hypothetical protein
MIEPEDFGPLDAHLRRIREATADERLRQAASQMLRAMTHYRKMRSGSQPTVEKRRVTNGSYLMRCLELVVKLQWEGSAT